MFWPKAIVTRHPWASRQSQLKINWASSFVRDCGMVAIPRGATHKVQSEYGLRPNNANIHRTPGAMPQATVSKGLRPY